MLTITGEHFNNLVNNIGLYQSVSAYKARIGRNSSVPYAADALCTEVQQVRARLGWKPNGIITQGRFPRTRAVIEAGRSGSLSKETLAHELDLLSGLLDHKFVERCLAILEGCYVFDPVVLVEEIEKPQTVYDVCVPDGHLFWCSGLVSHNTQLAIEAMASCARTYPKSEIFYRETEEAFDEAYADKLGLPLDRINFLPERTADPDGPVLETIEDLFEDLSDQLRRLSGKSSAALYVTDSLDGLSDDEEMRKGEKDIRDAPSPARKARWLSQIFRQRVRRVAETNMHLMFVSQIRDKIGTTMGRKTDATGGKALRFYASQRVELTNLGQVTREMTIKGTKVRRAVGVNIQAHVVKNRLRDPHAKCEFDILFNYGIDNLRASVEWLHSVGEFDRISDLKGKAALATYMARAEKLDDSAYFKLIAGVDREVGAVWAELDKRFAPIRRKYQ